MSIAQSPTLVDSFQQQQHSKRKLDDYAPFPDDSSSSSGRMRTAAGSNDTLNDHIGRSSDNSLNVFDARSDSGLPECQLFIKMTGGPKTLVLRADSTETVEQILLRIESRSKIRLKGHRLLYGGKQLSYDRTLAECGIGKEAHVQLRCGMCSIEFPEVWQLVDEIVQLIFQTCRGKTCSGNYSGMYLIKIRLKEYFDEIPQIDIDKGAGHLRVFLSCHAPSALANLYVSAVTKGFAENLIRQIVVWIDLLPQSLHDHCVPILLEVCNLLRCVSIHDAIYIRCRTSLGNMVRNMKLDRINKDNEGVNFVVRVQDTFVFVSDLVGKLCLDMNACVELDKRTGHVVPSMSEVIDLKNFLHPIKLLVKIGLAFNHDLQNYGGEIEYLYSIFSVLLEKMDHCLSVMDKSLLAKDESVGIGCYEYLAILIELNSISKLYHTEGERFWTMLSIRKHSFCYLIVKYAIRSDDHDWIFEHMELTTFECRRHLAMMLLPEVMDEYDEIHEMLIERSHLLAESFEYIVHADTDTLRAGLSLEFKNEEATGPGVLREWFFLVCQAIFDPRNALFVACPNDHRRFFPNPASKVDPLHLEYFKFAGRAIALALIHKVQIGIVFDRVLFLQLAGKGVSLQDIRDADPILYSSCKKVLEMDPEIVDQDALALTFVVEIEELGSRKVVELSEGGKNIVVNSKNRRNYVDLLIQHHFVKSVADQVAHLTQGFDDIIDSPSLRKSFFQRLELEDLDRMLHGSEKAISVEDWKAHTKYYGYEVTDIQISWFWKIIEGMSAEQRKILLFFWTSVKFLPVEGFGGLSTHLSIHKKDVIPKHLPSSHTCFYQLCFPPYQSFEVMQDSLGIITQEHVACSFGSC